MAKMTDQELAEWGDSEDAARKADLAAASHTGDYESAKSAAARRRKAAGLTVGQAARAVIDSQRRRRLRETARRIADEAMEKQ